MPSKHIPDDTWKKIEKLMLDATIKTKTRFKDSELIELILEVGLKNISEDDFWRLAKSKNAKE